MAIFYHHIDQITEVKDILKTNTENIIITYLESVFVEDEDGYGKNLEVLRLTPIGVCTHFEKHSNAVIFKPLNSELSSIVINYSNIVFISTLNQSKYLYENPQCPVGLGVK